MKLLDYVLLSLSVVLLVIGIDQLFKFGVDDMKTGLAASYFIFMFSGMALILFNYRRHKRKEHESVEEIKDSLKKKKKR